MPPSLFTYLIDVNNKQEIMNLIPLLEVHNQVEEHLSHSTNTSSVEIFNREEIDIYMSLKAYDDIIDLLSVCQIAYLS